MIATPERVLFDKFYLYNGIPDTAIIIFVFVVKDIIELQSELLDFLNC